MSTAVPRGPAASGGPAPLKSIRDPNTLICDGFRLPLRRCPGTCPQAHGRCPRLIRRDETLCPQAPLCVDTPSSPSSATAASASSIGRSTMNSVGPWPSRSTCRLNWLCGKAQTCGSGARQTVAPLRTVSNGSGARHGRSCSAKTSLAWFHAGTSSGRTAPHTWSWSLRTGDRCPRCSRPERPPVGRSVKQTCSA